MRRMTIVTLLAVSLPAACGGSDSDGDPGDDSADDSGPGDGHSGRIVAEGTGSIHTLDLDSSDPWVARANADVYDAVAVVLSQNEVLTATDSFGSPMVVQVADLETFGVLEDFEWPYNEDVGRVNGLAVSSDGQHMAALLEDLGPQYLEVVNREDLTVVYSGLDLISDETMTWTPNDELVFALSLAVEKDPDRWGAIGAVPLERFYEATDQLDIDLYAIFTRAEWESGVTSVAVSPDGSQLMYTRAGDLWVMDFAAGAPTHQLTTGPVYDGGAQFSPDGTAIAFAAGDRDFATETYIIPNHRDEPLFIDHGQDSGDEYLTGEGTLVDRIMAWAP